MEVLHIERADPPGESLVTPFCPSFGDCGGCRGQHLPYARQMELKTEPVLAGMQELGTVPEIVEPPSFQGYRDRMDFSVEGGILGLRGAREFGRFVDIDTCAIQQEPANAILRIVRSVLAEFPGLGFERTTGSGILKYATIRTGLTNCLVLTVDEGKTSDERYLAFVRLLEGKLPADCSLVETTTKFPSDVSCPPGGRAIRGQAGLKSRLGGIDFDVAYDAFFQPYPEAFDRLLAWCKKFGAGGGDSLVDLYCGTGVLSSIWTSWFSGQFKHVRGFEFTESAVVSARKNFEGFQGSATFEAVDLTRVEIDLKPNDFVIADPPRAGLSPGVRKSLLANPAKNFLYISCNPESQIRDLNELKVSYEIAGACIVDCYPQTPHLEQAVFLRSKP
ncbi:MAG: class I SAM-dependent RNA methyltransferase [Leptospirales bacterium]|nr:class I SAM-dependent RNA methyltransferase [Leptospirales bacterium]